VFSPSEECSDGEAGIGGVDNAARRKRKDKGEGEGRGGAWRGSGGGDGAVDVLAACSLGEAAKAGVGEAATA